MRRRGFELNLNVLRISKLLLSEPSKKRCGYEIAKALEINTTTTYDILERMEREAWVSSTRERSNHQSNPNKKPAIHNRRLFRITGKGHQNAGIALALLQLGK